MKWFYFASIDNDIIMHNDVLDGETINGLNVNCGREVGVHVFNIGGGGGGCYQL